MYERAHELLVQGVQQRLFPGAALCIGHGECVESEFCTGSLSYALDAPAVTSDTLYDIASMTKVVCTTMLCLRALETGRLFLQDTLERFFPSVSLDKAGITIQQLLTHSSGIVWHFYLSEQCAAPADAISAVLAQPLAYPTGTRTEYSCMGFMLLRGILEQVYGDDLTTLFAHEVAQPLGLRQTGFCPADPSHCAPTEQQLDGSFLQGIVHDENARFLQGVSSNAGLFAPITDIARFVQMLGSGGNLDGHSYLSPATLAAATHNYTLGCAHNRGLGFKLYGGSENFMGDLMRPESFGHTGFTGTSFAVEGTGGLWVALLTNHVHPKRGNAEALRFRRLIYNAISADYHRYHP